MTAQPIIQVEDLDVYYGTCQILFDVGFSVRQGETMALLGRNGAGKSTTQKAIMGLCRAQASVSCRKTARYFPNTQLRTISSSGGKKVRAGGTNGQSSASIRFFLR